MRIRFATLVLAITGLLGFHLVTATPAYAAPAAPVSARAVEAAAQAALLASCPVESSNGDAINDIPFTIDGHVQLRTDYYDCGDYVIVSSRKWDQYSGAAVRGYYDANIAYYSNAIWRYKRTGQSFGENVWINMVDFTCWKPCLMVHVKGSKTDVIAYLDGTLQTASDELT